jgi:hypothetical protein
MAEINLTRRLLLAALGTAPFAHLAGDPFGTRIFRSGYDTANMPRLRSRKERTPRATNTNPMAAA